MSTVVSTCVWTKDCKERSLPVYCRVMKDFESFKASREKMDPSSRDMSEHKWQQAYDAYRRAREQVGQRRSSGRTSRSARSAGRGKARFDSAPASLEIRRQVRESGAYQDLRLIIEVLFWTVLALLVVAALVRSGSGFGLSAVVVLLDCLIQIAALVGLRLLSHAIVDIPDIALFRMTAESDRSSGKEPTGSDEAEPTRS